MIVASGPSKLDRAERLVNDLDIQYGASYFSRSEEVTWAMQPLFGPAIPGYLKFGRDFRGAVERGAFLRGVRGECAELATYLSLETGAGIAKVSAPGLGGHFINIAPVRDLARGPDEHPEDWAYYDACLRRGGPLGKSGYVFRERIDPETVGKNRLVRRAFLLFFDDSPVWSAGGAIYFLCPELDQSDNFRPGVDQRPAGKAFAAEAERIGRVVGESWREFQPEYETLLACLHE